jgi:GR25 family glycosyltransferase involved in LPS biosynthesis
MSQRMSSWTIESIPAFCITLERRQDRWRRFQDQSGIEGLDLKRFLGVDGKKLDIKDDPRVTTLTKRNIATKTRRSHEELDTIGGVGCALSHVAVWQWLVDNDHEMVLVFEDDAVVPPDFIERADKCINESTILKDPKKWDMWLLGGQWEDLTKIPDETETVRIGAFVLFHAYVITKRCARKLLKDVYPIHCHIDIWASIYAHFNDLRFVGCPHLVLDQTQRVKTDIQPNNTCHICNVPTDYEKNNKIVSKLEWNVAQAAEIVAVGLIAYIIYRQVKG